MIIDFQDYRRTSYKAQFEDLCRSAEQEELFCIPTVEQIIVANRYMGRFFYLARMRTRERLSVELVASLMNLSVRDYTLFEVGLLKHSIPQFRLFRLSKALDVLNDFSRLVGLIDASLDPDRKNFQKNLDENQAEQIEKYDPTIRNIKKHISRPQNNIIVFKRAEKRD